jgi:hypothetical protein
VDFETVLKIIVTVAAAVAIPIAAYAAIYATRAIWVRRPADDMSATGRLVSEMDALKVRLSELEAGQGRVMELEERLDFAERLLAQLRDPSRLGAGEHR